jgi:hypothetical protein
VGKINFFGYHTEGILVQREKFLDFPSADGRRAESLLLEALSQQILSHLVAELTPDPAYWHSVEILKSTLGPHLLDPLLDDLIKSLLYLFIAYDNTVLDGFRNDQLLVDHQLEYLVPQSGSTGIYPIVEDEELYLRGEFGLKDDVPIDNSNDPVERLAIGS